LYGKFLTAIEDGNPTKSEKQQINFDKFRRLFKIIHQISEFQKVDYPFQVEPSISLFLKNVHTLNEDESFQQSLICEPKKQTQAHTKQKSIGFATTTSNPSDKYSSILSTSSTGSLSKRAWKL